MAPKREAWLSLLPSDPRPALLASEEPFAHFVTLTAVLGKSEDDAEVRAARKDAVAEDKQSTAEIVRALATVFGADGMVTPRSCYKGFEIA